MADVWAHRGASSVAPENSLHAFELAFDLGAGGIELDVQRSKDGVVVVCHDVTINRTSDGSGQLWSLDYATLRKFNFSHGFPGFHPIPTLAEVLDLVSSRDGVVNIEFKSPQLYPGITEQVDKMVRSRNMVDQVWYSSFDLEALARLQTSPVPRAVLYSDEIDNPLEYAHRVGAAALHPMHTVISQGLVDAAREDGVRIHGWTVDDPATVTRLVSCGVDAVITNEPQMARETISAVEG